MYYNTDNASLYRRNYVAGKYPGKWPSKVAKMSDAQVLAIFEGIKKREIKERRKEREHEVFNA